MTRSIRTAVAAAVAATVLASPAIAHISYSGRDFGSFTGLIANSVTLGANVTGNYGWADATDGDLGDSHRSRAFRFHLDEAATVTISVTGLERTGGLGGLLPGFSLYSGLAHIAGAGQEGDHDTAPTSLAYLATLDGGVQILDVTSPTSITRVATVATAATISRSRGGMSAVRSTVPRGRTRRDR